MFSISIIKKGHIQRIVKLEHKPSRILALTDMNDGPMRYGRDMTACTSVIWFIHHHIMTGMKKSLKEMKTEQIHITEGVISQRAHITESVISRPYQIGPSSYQSRLHPTGLGGHSCLYFRDGSSSLSRAQNYAIQRNSSSPTNCRRRL